MLEVSTSPACASAPGAASSDSAAISGTTSTLCATTIAGGVNCCQYPPGPEPGT